MLELFGSIVGDLHAPNWTLETCGSSTELEWSVREVEMALCLCLVGGSSCAKVSCCSSNG